MSKNPSAPLPGELAIDLTPLKAFLVDLPPGAMQGMRTEQDGFPEVILEITANQPKYGDAAGITGTDFTQFKTLNDQLTQIQAQLPAAQKILEILLETKAQIDDQRQRLVSAFAQAAESRSKVSGDTSLLARYEKTRAYRSAIADKAAKTRQKNAEAKATAAKTPAGQGGGQTPPP